jgi:alkylation response protein AidB-like acyl-CoA dehydrogenase
VPEPLLTSAVAAVALRAVDRPAAHDALSALASHGRLTTWALHEAGRGAARYDVEQVRTRLEGAGGAFRLTGEKSHVPHATAAERVIVPARDDAGQHVLALVPVDRAGVVVTRQVLLDLRPVGSVRFDGAAVSADEVLATGTTAERVLHDLAEHTRVALAAECLGLAQRAFELTIEWLKERHQFGVAIGSFQALQHRAAGLYVQLTLARSAVDAAVAALEDPEGTRVRTGHEPTRLVSLAKAVACDTAEQVAREAIQMHGGIGMTDEHDIGWYLKRARVSAATLGDSAWHRARWARLGGYA